MHIGQLDTRLPYYAIVHNRGITMKTALGKTLDPANTFRDITTALQNIPATGSGYIWVLYRKAWHISGNYLDGAAWNGGYAQHVLADACSLSALTRTAL